MRKLRRVLEHVGDISLKKDKLIPRHMWDKHGVELDGLQFWGLNQVKLGRKGNLDTNTAYGS